MFTEELVRNGVLRRIGCSMTLEEVEGVIGDQVARRIGCDMAEVIHFPFLFRTARSNQAFDFYFYDLSVGCC